MSGFHKWDRPRGTVHNLAHALSLKDSGTNIICCSDATLYVLQNLVALDIEFKSRWADEVFQHGYKPIDTDSANYGEWVDLINQIQGEVVDMSCDIVDKLDEMLIEMQNTNTVLSDLKTALEAQTTALDPDDTLIDDLEPIMDAINVVLGGAAILAGG